MIPVLYVDDESTLLDVTKIYMEKSGEFSVDISLSAEDALSRLAATSYEAVISDYQMPGMNGLELLKVIREKYPLLPFILFTGRGREEVAIEALNSGADFYLQKGGEPKSQFAELKNKVQQIVRRRAAEKALAESRERYRVLVENINDIIFSLDEKGIITYISPVINRFGAQEADVINKPFSDFVHPDDLASVNQHIGEIRQGIDTPFEFRMISAGDNQHFMRSSSRAVFEGDIYRGVQGVLTDISDRKKAEARIIERERRYRNVFESASDAMVVQNKDTGAILDANSAAQYLYKYTLREFQTLTCDSLVAEPEPDDRCTLQGPAFCPVVYHRRKDGTRFPVEVTESTYPQKNRTISILSIRNITNRKVAEERILATRRLYVVLSQINEAIVRVRDLETLLREICRIAVEHGHFRMAWVGLVDKEQGVISPVAHAGFEDGYLAAVRIPLDDSPEGSGPTGSAFRSGSQVILSDIATDPRMEPWREEAVKRGYRSSAAFPFSLHGGVVGVINLYSAEPGFFTGTEVELLREIAEDVSFALGLLDEQARRARAEQALTGSEERARFLATILEMSSQPFYIGYEDGRFGVTNPAFLDLLGYTDAEMKNLSWKDLTPPEFAGIENRELQDLIDTGLPRRYEKEFIRKDSARIPVEIFAHKAADSGGNVRYFYSFVTDVTTRRKVLSESLQAKREWESIFSATGNPALILDASQTILEANDAVLRLTGKTREELRTMKCWQVFHGAGRTSPPEGCPFIRMKESGTLETSPMTVSALGSDYLVSCTPVMDEAGRLERVIHIATDITSLKHAERALTDSEARYRTIFEKSTDAVLLMNGTIIDCNPAAEQLFGYPRAMIIGHDAVEFSPPVQPDGAESKEAAATYNLAAYEWGNQFFPWQYRKNDGRPVDCDVSLSSVMVGGERRLIAIIRDITARKLAEADIEKSEQTLRLITDSVSDMVWLSDLDFRPVYISPSAARLWGYTLEELQNLPLDNRLEPESVVQIIAKRDELLGKKSPGDGEIREPVTLELEFGKKGGGTFWSENTLALIRDDEGSPVRILSVGRDITERKRLENQVRRLASFPQLNPEPVLEISLDKDVIFANPACQTILEKLRMPNYPAAFLPPDIDAIMVSLKDTRSAPVGREVTVGDAVFEETLTLSPGGRAVRIYAHDISSRYRETGALARANRKLHLLTGITRHDIRNRLTGVLGYIELAKSSTTDPALLEYLSRSEASANLIRHQIEFTKEYENLGSSAPVWHDVSSLIASVRTQLDLHGVALEDTVEGASIYADPMFGRIIVHLVDNALRHGGAQLSRIRFSGSLTPDGYVLVCEDNGIGIPKKDKASIFRRVVGEDTKIGLFLVQEVLSLTMIMIRENGEPDQGARFELTVPLGAYRMPESDPVEGLYEDQ